VQPVDERSVTTITHNLDTNGVYIVGRRNTESNLLALYTPEGEALELGEFFDTLEAPSPIHLAIYVRDLPHRPRRDENPKEVFVSDLGSRRGTTINAALHGSPFHVIFKGKHEVTNITEIEYDA